MKKKKTVACFLLMAACVLGTAEQYRSAGFSADIGSNGIIRNLQYAGQPLAKSIGLVGTYRIPKEMKKHDARLFQAWDFSDKAQFQRDGDTLTITVDSMLGNKEINDAANYKIHYVLKPNELACSCEVTQKVDLLSDFHLFNTDISMPPSLFGRGVKVLTGNDQQEFQVLPETFNPKFRLGGKQISLSTEKGILTFTGDKDVRFNYTDSRQWGGTDFMIIVNPFAKWTPKPVLHPAGTVWKWSFTLAFTPER